MTIAVKLYLNNDIEKSYINSTKNQIDSTNISISNSYNKTVNYFMYKKNDIKSFIQRYKHLFILRHENTSNNLMIN